MKRKISNFAVSLLSTIILAQALPVYANTSVATQPVAYTQSEDFSNFDVNKAFDSDLYYARSILSEEGQKAWDVALDVLLNYDNSDNKYPLKDSEGNRLVEINYKDLGIKIDSTQAGYIQKYLVRQEPRMFHLKDWGADVKIGSDGLVEKQIFHIGNSSAEGDSYQQTLRKVDEEANKILSVIKDDMTIYQKIRAVQDAFEKSVSYQIDAPRGSDIRGMFLDKKGICGGYAKGFEYLLLKMGIENIWVNGYAGGAHAWNHIKLDGKWYLMDTTWGGKNWYLRGNVPERFVYDTYHIIPPLAEEGIPYKWGEYPGVWIDADKMIILPLNSSFNPLDYIKDFGDVYGNDLKNDIIISENTVDTSKAGEYKVVYELTNKDGQKAVTEMKVKVVSGDVIPLTSLKSTSGNFTEKEVSLYYNGEENAFKDGLFKSEDGFMQYDVSQSNAKYFEANVGINKNVRDNTSYGHYGKVQFEVYADNNLIYTSKTLGWKDNFEHILVEIPEGTRTIKLVNVPKGDGNNHGAWGDATIYTEKSDIEQAKQELQQVIDFADKITDVSYVLATTHQQQRYNNFVYDRNFVKEEAKKDNNVEYTNQLKDYLIYSLSTIEQVYVPGGEPVRLETEDTDLTSAKQELQQVIDFADKVTDVSYVLATTHQQQRYNNFVYDRNFVKEEAKKDNDVEYINQLKDYLIYSLSAIGQEYVAGGEPVRLETEDPALTSAKQELQQVIDFADKVTDVSYVLATTHQQQRYNNFVYDRDFVKSEAKKDNDVEYTNQLKDYLIYSLSAIGQEYVAGGEPVKKQ